jgi:hypothetical protein
LKDIVGKLGALLVECGKRRCSGIEVKIFKELMVDGAAFHGDLEMEERTERDFPDTGKILCGVLAEILMVLVHLFNFRQQDLFDSFRVGHRVPPLVKSDNIL